MLLFAFNQLFVKVATPMVIQIRFSMESVDKAIHMQNGAIILERKYNLQFINFYFDSSSI